jgi:hypothetical protein
MPSIRLLIIVFAHDWPLAPEVVICGFISTPILSRKHGWLMMIQKVNVDQFNCHVHRFPVDLVRRTDIILLQGVHLRGYP